MADRTVPQGECFSWAFGNLPPEAILVHAIVHDPWSKKPFEHAWVELNDRVYDWQSVVMGLGPGKVGWSKDHFYEAYRPKAVKKYDKIEASKLALKHRHSGPW